LEGTLDTEGNYTCISDIFQVGVMMQGALCPTSEEGKSFVGRLKSKQWTAEEALKQPFCSRDGN